MSSQNTTDSVKSRESPELPESNFLSGPYIEITSKVDSHHTNQNYQVVRVDLLNDPAFHFAGDKDSHGIYLVKADWCPTDAITLELSKQLWKQSPTFRNALKLAVYNNWWISEGP